MNQVIPNNEQVIISDLRLLIDEARQHLAISANSTITLLYWHIGERINRDVLDYKRAKYGKSIIENISRQLQLEYGGREFSTRNLRRMMQFSQSIPDFKIVSTLSTQLSWSHFLEVLPLTDEISREFYLTMAAEESWSIRTLREKINGMLYERTAIASEPKELIKAELASLRNEHAISPELVFKSPYFLDFTGLKGNYSESDLENALLSHLENFLLELGDGFTFVARQKRLIIDGEDFKIDLLFYHRKLRRMIAVDLKLGKFKAEYKGQMELYLRYLDRYEREQGEEAPLGLILCTEGNRERIELLQLDAVGIKVANYLTELPPKEILINQLQISLDEVRKLRSLKN